MKKLLFIFFIGNLLLGQKCLGQGLDTAMYKHLLESDNQGFIKYAHSVGLSTTLDSSSNLMSAKAKGILFFKQISDTAKTEYKLLMIVSSLDKENNKIILKDARLVDSKSNMWQDDKYLYREWNIENAYSKEIWYKVLIYGRR